VSAVVIRMRVRLIALLVAAAPFLLAGCGKGKY
jgi:predicted small secreted protein